MTTEILAVTALLALLGAGVVLLIYGTVTRSKWGINVRRVTCPRCSTTAPTVRLPRSLAQALCGGWTCSSCGCDMDKWGRQVTT